MAEPYVGEIRMFGGNFAPVGWLFCDGSIQSISENETLFQLIGTTYGGDGQSTFALPDLRGRLPVHAGPGYTLAQSGGAENVTLTAATTPTHTHAWGATNGAAQNTSPIGGMVAKPTPLSFDTGAPTSPMDSQMVQSTGGSQPHTNLMPSLCVNFIISLYGIFPSPT